jgi:hypothetical protein
MKVREPIGRNASSFLPIAIIIGIVSMAGIGLIALNAAGAQTSLPPTAVFNIQNLVYPMEINATSVQLSTIASQPAATIELVAYNNLGNEPTYANATVNLLSLTISLGYQYSTAGGIVRGSVNSQPSVNVTLGSDDTTVFSVVINNLAIPSGELTSLSVTGGYTWELQASSNVHVAIDGSGQINPLTQDATTS